MLNAHPYEEPAYDIIRLDQQTNVMGLGRVGYLPQEMTLHAFTQFVKQQLDVPAVRVVGDLQSKVKKLRLSVAMAINISILRSVLGPMYF